MGSKTGSWRLCRQILSHGKKSAKGKEAGPTEILDTLIDDAYERGVLEENSVVYRDLLIQNSWAA